MDRDRRAARESIPATNNEVEVSLAHIYDPSSADMRSGEWTSSQIDMQNMQEGRSRYAFLIQAIS